MPKNCLRTLTLLLCLTSTLTHAQDEAQNPEAEASSETAQLDDEKNKTADSSEEKVKAEPVDRSPTAPLDQELSQQEDIAKELTDLQWLEAPSGKFAAIWTPDHSGSPVGALLVLHDEGQTPYWPTTLANIHEHLSLHGWSVLSMALPNPQASKIPQRPEKVLTKNETSSKQGGATEEENKQESNDEPAQDENPTPDEKEIIASEIEESENKDDVKTKEPASETDETMQAWQRQDVEPISEERLKAAVTFLHQNGQFNIVLAGHGLGAARALKLLTNMQQGEQEATQKAFQALVFIQARHTIPDSEFKFLDNLAKAKLPICDLYFHPDIYAFNQAKMRRKAANKAGIKPYLSRKILFPQQLNTDKENRLSRTLRGFLKKYATGLEVEG